MLYVFVFPEQIIGLIVFIRYYISVKHQSAYHTIKFFSIYLCLIREKFVTLQCDMPCFYVRSIGYKIVACVYFPENADVATYSFSCHGCRWYPHRREDLYGAEWGVVQVI